MSKDYTGPADFFIIIHKLSEQIIYHSRKHQQRQRNYVQIINIEYIIYCTMIFEVLLKNIQSFTI